MALRILLVAGANPNAKTDAGMTALHREVTLDPPNREKVELLVGAGADINTTDHRGFTPLDLNPSWTSLEQEFGAQHSEAWLKQRMPAPPEAPAVRSKTSSKSAASPQRKATRSATSTPSSTSSRASNAVPRKVAPTAPAGLGARLTSFIAGLFGRGGNSAS